MASDAAYLDQRDLHAAASIRTAPGGAGVMDRQVAVDHELLSVRSVHADVGGITMIDGHSMARRKLVLQLRNHLPALAVHITLRGTAFPHPSDRPTDGGTRPGEWLVLGGQQAQDVTMEAGVENRGLRVNFSRRYLDSLARRCPEIGARVDAAVMGQAINLVHAPPMALGSVASLVEELGQSERYGDLRRLFLESTALSLLARALSGARVGPAPLPPRDRDRVLEARARLLASMRNPPTLGALARMVGTNEFRLKRDFKLLFGEPVHAFLLRRRLEHARALLLDRERSVKEIAADVGYAHVAHFSAAFRKRFGMPPTALRR
ncbi:MAG TPA: AraC family transcriptional regulator [Polyangia bacterium]|nr:AraC family transcriptional regulator [Polyangia bacterium]